MTSRVLADMGGKLMVGPCWSTAAFGGGGTGALLDRDALGEHLQRCQGGVGRGFALRCGAEKLNGFIAARFVSSVLMLALVVGGVLWLVL